MRCPSFVAPDPRLAALARITAQIASGKVCDTRRRFLEGRAYEIRHQLMVEGCLHDADA
ncbi:hypothetical protein IQ24_02639 [Paracoccus sulfuroxidans]|uniref:Uncharacterized protein n=1 Tax=Paracoccus sulfuroxidans TaxID=384678 RepID=A0A562NKR7_9RHOB|nr:hypothetical protein IQ24_02639 [Paracoccus sulfuroxidans]